MRAFVAIHPPDAVTEALAELQLRLPVGRPVQPEQMHLTLAFLGEQPDDLIESVHFALQGIRAPGFTLQPGGLGSFGKPVPRVLWAGLGDSAALAALRARIRSAAHGAGLELDRSRFRPHLTIARLGRLSGEETARLARFLTLNAGFSAPSFQVRHFALWRSTLTRAGALHEELARYPLQAG